VRQVTRANNLRALDDVRQTGVKGGQQLVNRDGIDLLLENMD